MELKQIHNIAFDIEETIVTATLASSDELLLLASSGVVVRHSISKDESESIFTVKSPFTHADGGYDLEEQSTIYTLDSIVVVVNDFKLHGVVHYPDNYNSLPLWRGEYHAEISHFPIALFKNEEEVPHLIYGKDWNHIQIMNLETRQILTAAKSLIEENAEEDRIAFYEKHEESNKLAWPSPFDYFYGRLEMSPNNKNFLSAGWAWGSCDAYSVFNVDDFITNPRIAAKNIGGWEHDNRATCWINDETIAVAYDPRVEGDDDTTKESPNQLHFYQLNDDGLELNRKIEVVGLNLVHSEIYFQKALNAIVVISDIKGIAVVSLDGDILLNEETMIQDSYNPELNLFLKVDGKNVAIHELVH